MIYFDEHYRRGALSTYTWLNEALSQAAEYYSGYDEKLHKNLIREFLSGNYNHLSLTHWTRNSYGYGALFIRYLIDQYGDSIIRNLCATDKVGIAAVEAATGEDFNIIFADFVRAMVMSGTGDSVNARYQFKSLDLQALQPEGRGGLISSSWDIEGESGLQSYVYPYEIAFYNVKSNVRFLKLRWDSSIHGVGFALSR